MNGVIRGGRFSNQSDRFRCSMRNSERVRSYASTNVGFRSV